MNANPALTDQDVSDAYLYVLLTWAGNLGLELPAVLQAFSSRVARRAAVQSAQHI